jgi:uncharacterized coiled-coil DUF342 family protein
MDVRKHGTRANEARRGWPAWLWPLLSLLLLLLLPMALHSQQQASLTDKEVDDLRDAAQDPEARIKLYLGFIDDRIAVMHQLAGDPDARNRAARLHNLFQEFTELSDELSDNLDNFDQQHGDMRKVLKLVEDKTAAWDTTLKAPKTASDYEFVRTSAIDANQDVHDDAVQILDEQTKYFAEQKAEAKKEAKEKKDSGDEY